MEIVDILETGGSKLQEVLVVVDHHHGELHGRGINCSTRVSRLGSEGVVCNLWQFDFSTSIQFQTVVYGILRLFLRILKISLHITYTGDDLQHL